MFDKGDIIVNEKQAELLGITIPESIKQDAKVLTEIKEEEQ